MTGVQTCALPISWELLYNDDVPDAVAVAEAVGLARELSTDDSPNFVNGLLGRLQKIKPTLLAAQQADPESGDQPTVAQVLAESASLEQGVALPDFDEAELQGAQVLAPSSEEQDEDSAGSSDAS